ncbi:YitT family protein [Viridibacillus sp. NPDC096237]|uniref:YitT family protein n=1 Tax=Viridibacillus sp. NPDC096237 TaxID=3390721 RepID=UPI003D07842C
MCFLKKSIIVIVGSILVSLGINLFLAPYEVLDGGIIGLGLISNYIWGLKVGLIIILLSIPIFIIAWFHYRDYFYNSLHGLIVSSFFIDILESVHFLVHIDAVYSSILGGILIGLGDGLMLRFKTSTGGTDLIAQFISDKTGINVGSLILFIDSIVIFLGGLILSFDTFFLSIITVLVIGMTINIFTKNVVQT